MKILFWIIVGTIALGGWCLIWQLGGINLEELKVIGKEKAQEVCGENSQIVYQGYQRSIIGGFGGRTWYQCKINNVWYQFAITQRVDRAEPQVYNFEQKTTFPNDFNIKN